MSKENICYNENSLEVFNDVYNSLISEFKKSRRLNILDYYIKSYDNSFIIASLKFLYDIHYKSEHAIVSKRFELESNIDINDNNIPFISFIDYDTGLNRVEISLRDKISNYTHSLVIIFGVDNEFLYPEPSIIIETTSFNNNYIKDNFIKIFCSIMNELIERMYKNGEYKI